MYKNLKLTTEQSIQFLTGGWVYVDHPNRNPIAYIATDSGMKIRMMHEGVMGTTTEIYISYEYTFNAKDYMIAFCRDNNLWGIFDLYDALYKEYTESLESDPMFKDIDYVLDDGLEWGVCDVEFYNPYAKYSWRSITEEDVLGGYDITCETDKHAAVAAIRTRSMTPYDHEMCRSLIEDSYIYKHKISKTTDNEPTHMFLEVQKLNINFGTGAMRSFYFKNFKIK